MNRFTLTGILFTCVLIGVAHGQNADREADHEALRALKTAFVEAVNHRTFDALQPLVHTNFTFTTSDNQKFTGVDALRDYWKGLFEGDGALLESLTIQPEADELTYFIGPNVGVTQGTSEDTYTFKKLGERAMPSRWTAVVVKVDGAWKVSRVHMSSNVVENPIVDAHKKARIIFGAITGIVGFIVGALLFRRRKPASA